MARRRACARGPGLPWSAALNPTRSRTVVFFGGRFVTPDEARVGITSRGYLLGEGVFATLRGYDGVCFRAERHLETLARGAAMFGLRPGLCIEELAELADEAATLTDAQNAYVRITVTRGVEEQSILSVLAKPMDVPSAEDFTRGVRAAVVSLRRNPPACGDGTVKTTSYAPQVLARREAESRGASEGIQLAVDGSLACGTMANLFVVGDNVIRTPSLETGCRAGVTREAVIAIAKEQGLTVREERIDPAALAQADEAFFTSTRVECLPIATVDGQPVGRGANFARTTALREALGELVRAETSARRATHPVKRRDPRGTPS